MVKWVIIAGIVGFIVITFKDYLPKTVEEKLSAAEVDCLTAMLRADSKGETDHNIAKVQFKIADTAMRYRDAHGVSLCEILNNNLLSYPPGWKRKVTDMGRSVSAVKLGEYIGSNPGAPWLAAHARAIEAMKKGPDKKLCATQIVRVDPSYTWATNELNAQQMIKKTMKQEPSDTKTEFYCK